MLKKFFMGVLSSFMGAWIALVVFVVVAIIVLCGVAVKMGTLSDKENELSKSSVLVLELKGVIGERAVTPELDYMALLQGNAVKPLTLSEIETAIHEAKVNDDVEAIYLKCCGVEASPATLDAIRDALMDFREEKPVIAYGDSFTTGDYYLATTAQVLCLNPAGALDLKGIGGTSFYFASLFEKLGIQFQVAKVGTFKSAVEPFIMNEMSEPARAQLDTLYSNIWYHICSQLTTSREKMNPDLINGSINNKFIFLQSAEYAFKQGFVDRLVYERSMDSIIAAKIKIDKDKIKFVKPSAVASHSDWGKGYNSKKQVAVLYAVGEIMDGGGSSTINFEKLVPQIVELAENDDVKALVLRVNSPGGSVFGSDQIGEALDYFQSKKKPLVVSMGDYAASGGYWISCCADRIFADPLTITGSIGIFGLIPNISELVKKIGVTPQTVSTNPAADFPSLFYPLTERQMEGMQTYVERGYDQFISRVARGRKMKKDEVKRIAEGRVWDAVKAHELGLVDELGGLEDAVSWAAQKVFPDEDYKVALYPTVEQNVWSLLPDIAEMRMHETLKRNLPYGCDDKVIQFVIKVLSQKNVQARMPYLTIGFAPAVL